MNPAIELYDFQTLMPEITMAALACIALMIGVFSKQNAYRMVAVCALAILAAVFYLTFEVDAQNTALRADYVTTIFNAQFRVDPFAMIVKMMVLASGAVSILLSVRYFEQTGENRFELFILMLFAMLGMMVMISANHFLVLYVGLELQSLSLYLLAAFCRDDARSNEAGLKYFVLGALSSGLLLFGISFIYGFSGSLGYMHVYQSISSTAVGANLGLVTGVVFLLVGMAFKISAVPFHMWTPDVYQGAPTPVTAFFSTAPKIAALAVLVRLFSNPFGSSADMWQDVVVFLSAASMVVGAIAALRQSNIKRLMAYSSIGHMGFVLMGLAASSQLGVKALVTYMIIYVVMSFGAFACILSMRRRGAWVEEIQDLCGLSKTNPVMALCLLVILFSLAGIPPMAGFFAKFSVIMAAVDARLYVLAVIGVVASVISAYYYLNIVKIMYFDEPREPLEKYQYPEMRAVMVISALALAFFIVWPDPVLQWSSRAATLIYDAGH